MSWKRIVLSALVLSTVYPVGAADDLPRVRDELLTTTDRSCAIHYLTHQNTTGWYLTEVEGECPYGVLDGYGSLAVRNAFGKVVDQRDGMFAQGYWMGREPMHVTLKSLFLGDQEEQTLVYQLGQEDRLNIRYLGTSKAIRRSDKSYGPFLGCAPARVLAVTPDTKLFEDETIQQNIIQSVIQRVQKVCSTPDKIYLYASEKENPENADVAFFADISLAEQQIKIRRLPSSNRTRNVLAVGGEEDDKPRPHEIRHESGLPVVQVTPVKPPVSRTNNSVSNSSSATNPAHTVVSPMNPEQIFKYQDQVPSGPRVQTDFFNEGTTAETPLQSDNKMTPALIDSNRLDEVPHLLTVSRLLGQSVTGKALVHIARFDEDGIALIDSPVALRAKGSRLSLGWGIAEGDFLYDSQPDRRGFVQIDTFTPVEPNGSIP